MEMKVSNPSKEYMTFNFEKKLRDKFFNDNKEFISNEEKQELDNSILSNNKEELTAIIRKLYELRCRPQNTILKCSDAMLVIHINNLVDSYNELAAELEVELLDKKTIINTTIDSFEQSDIPAFTSTSKSVEELSAEEVELKDKTIKFLRTTGILSFRDTLTNMVKEDRNALSEEKKIAARTILSAENINTLFDNLDMKKIDKIISNIDMNRLLKDSFAKDLEPMIDLLQNTDKIEHMKKYTEFLIDDAIQILNDIAKGKEGDYAANDLTNDELKQPIEEYILDKMNMDVYDQFECYSELFLDRISSIHQDIIPKETLKPVIEFTGVNHNGIPMYKDNINGRVIVSRLDQDKIEELVKSGTDFVNLDINPLEQMPNIPYDPSLGFNPMQQPPMNFGPMYSPIDFIQQRMGSNPMQQPPMNFGPTQMNSTNQPLSSIEQQLLDMQQKLDGQVINDTHIVDPMTSANSMEQIQNVHQHIMQDTNNHPEEQLEVKIVKEQVPQVNILKECGQLDPVVSGLINDLYNSGIPTTVEFNTNNQLIQVTPIPERFKNKKFFIDVSGKFISPELKILLPYSNRFISLIAYNGISKAVHDYITESPNIINALLPYDLYCNNEDIYQLNKTVDLSTIPLFEGREEFISKELKKLTEEVVNKLPKAGRRYSYTLFKNINNYSIIPNELAISDKTKDISILKCDEGIIKKKNISKTAFKKLLSQKF